MRRGLRGQRIVAVGGAVAVGEDLFYDWGFTGSLVEIAARVQLHEELWEWDELEVIIGHNH